MKEKIALLAMLSFGLMGCGGDELECGNGIVEDENAEVCDDGNTNNGDGCNAQCLSEGTCGNAVLDQGEECDEGAANGDLNGTCTNGCFNLDPDGYQASPTTVASIGNRLFVGLIHLDDNFQPGDGTILVLDRATGAEINRIPTSAPQPQFFTVSGTNLFVINSGVVQFINNFTDAITVVPGSVDVIDATAADNAASPDISIPFTRSANDPRQGSLGRAATFVQANDGLGLAIGSGLTSDVYIVDPFNEEILRGSDNPVSAFAGGLDTMSIFSRLGGTQLYATSFNTDQSCFTQDTIGFSFACTDVGFFPINDPAGFEGLKDIAFTDNGAFVAIFAVASSFTAGTVDANGALSIVAQQNNATGVDPERAVAFGNQVIIANGFGDSLQVIDVAQDGTATISAEVGLPAGSNPRDIAIEDQIDAITQMYVANQAGDTVIEFNLGGALPQQGQTFTILP